MLGIRGALLVLDALVPGSPLASSVLGALVADIGVGRAGAGWDADEAVERKLAIARFLRGLSVGVSLAAVALLGSQLFGWSSLSLGRPDPMLLLALLAALGAAMRDELLYRVLPLHVAGRAGVPGAAAIVFAATLSPAASLFAAQSTLEGLALQFGLGLLFASLTHHFRGAWAPIAAHTAWAFVVGPASRGGLLEAVYTSGELSDGALSSGGPAWLAAALAAAVGVFVVPRLAAGLSAASTSTPTPDAGADAD